MLVSALSLTFGAASESAQEGGRIVGQVQDASGGAMPGVTIEAASDALIERVRSAVSDASGRFALISLRPGTYTVTFSLTGFKSVRREGVILQGDFAATVNATLEVGAVEETITVSGASPVVDLQSTQNQFVVSSEILDTLPACAWIPFRKKAAIAFREAIGCLEFGAAEQQRA